MAKKQLNTTGRRDGRRFIKFYAQMLQSPRFHALSGHAVKALMYLASQYDGYSNNGDLSIAWKVAKTKGLSSNNSLRRGTLELIEAGFVIQTRQGGRNRCSLFALSWFPIDECKGKLDVSATVVAPIDWQALETLSGIQIEPNGVQLSEPNGVQLAPNGVQSGSISASTIRH